MNAKINAKQAWCELFGKLGDEIHEKTESDLEQPECAIIEEPILTESLQPISANHKKPDEKSYSASIISCGMTIYGNIKLLGNIELHGVVKGDVDTEGSAIVTGKILGNITCKKDITLSSATMQGNINASGTVLLDKNTVIVGDIKGKSASFNGRVRGNITVEDIAKFEKETVVIGDITANKVIMNEGAQMIGSVTINSESHPVEIEDIQF